jgi:cytochrome P450
MQCYTTQRDPTVYPNPDEFVPERWMDAAKVTNSMKTLFMPFSQGSRACLGKSLAIMELKMITASLIKYFDVGVSPTQTDDGMTMKDHFLVLPKGGKCDLVFSRVVVDSK